VTFSYDKNGYLLSEIWFSNLNALENKTEYYYSKDYQERIEQQYHMLGTEKSTKTIRRYDDRNNLVFEQSIEYTGHYQYAGLLNILLTNRETGFQKSITDRILTKSTAKRNSLIMNTGK
jgi:hypothetical protein